MDPRVLAINGGKPVRSTPFPPWPHFSEDSIEKVVECLRSGKVNYWTGEECRHFEREFAKVHECEFGIALANGTVALELALLALGISHGDEVIVTPRTFVASASCVVVRGATPVLADVDRDTQNITAETIAKVLTPRTKAIIPVHLGGYPCDMDPIMELARQHGLAVIEDCAQAQGARYKGRPIGSIGTVGAFSFCQDKLMTTGGEGGMLVLNDHTLWDRAWSYKDHGKSFDAVYKRVHPPGFRWLHESWGTNWRMTELQGTLGRSCLPRIPAWVEQRRENAMTIDRTVSGIAAFRHVSIPSDIYHCYYRYYVFVVPDRLREDWTRDRIMQAIVAEGIPCFSGSCSEIYLEKCFLESDLQPKRALPVAHELGGTSLAFLVHPTLTGRDVEDITRAIEKVMAVASC